MRQIDQVEDSDEKTFEIYTFDLNEELNNLPPINDIGTMPNNQYYNQQMNKRFIN